MRKSVTFTLAFGLALLLGANIALERAIAHLQQATRADATFAPTYRELGLAYYRTGESPKAVAALERYLALDPRAKDAPRINTAIRELKRS